MNILVTGGAGFIGSHIADILIKNNHNITIIDNLSNGNKKNLNPNAKFYNKDILNNLTRIFNKEKFDALIHNAALIDVTESRSKPGLYQKINVQGTLNLLEYCRKFNVNKFVYASSGGAVYGIPKYLPCDENHQLNPINPYGKTKLGAEDKIINCSNKYDISYTILRYSNIYGPRQNTTKGGVIAKFINSVLNNKEMIIYGNGAQTRDFLFVEDAALANLLALKTKNKIFNIGSGKPTSINQLCEEIKKLVNKKIKIIHKKPLKEIKNTYLDISLAEKELKWKPKTTLKDGLRKTYCYFKRTLYKNI